MDLWQALSTLEGLNTPKGSSASAKPQHCNSPGHRQRVTHSPQGDNPEGFHIQYFTALVDPQGFTKFNILQPWQTPGV